MAKNILSIPIPENKCSFLHNVNLIVSGNGTFTTKDFITQVMDELIARGEACMTFYE
jgi:hypothetical protein